VGLWAELQLQGAVFPGGAAEAAEAGLAMNVSGPVDRLVAFLGAGVYEELLFRLMLLGPATWVLRRVGMAPTTSIATAVVTTSLLFSAAHYLSGEPFFWFIFFFRFLAGTFFAVVFLYRGFGIAAGAHAGYDILVGVL
jgi:membrane protease YdiL (CAAX protease family)